MPSGGSAVGVRIITGRWLGGTSGGRRTSSGSGTRWCFRPRAAELWVSGTTSGGKLSFWEFFAFFFWAPHFLSNAVVLVLINFFHSNN